MPRVTSIKLLLLRLLVGLFVVSSGLSAFAKDLVGSFTKTVPVLQAYSTNHFISLTVMRTTNPKYKYIIQDSHGNDVTSIFKMGTNEVGSSYQADLFTSYVGDPNETYKLSIYDENMKPLDSRNFRTRQESKKVAVCSCSRIGLLSDDRQKVTNWDRLFLERPGFILSLGDIFYGDNGLQATLRDISPYRVTFEQIQQKAIEHWFKDTLYFQEDLIPVATVWDDHDFGYENADIHNKSANQVRYLYDTLYQIPIGHESVVNGPGLSYSFELYGQRVIMMDDRSQSDHKKKIVWGQEQLNWLRSLTQKGGNILLANGIPVVASTKRGASIQNGAPEEFAELQDIIRKSPARFLLLAGNTHYSEVRKIPQSVFGYEMTQIISSAVHSVSPKLIPPFTAGAQPKDPNQIAHTVKPNFVILDGLMSSGEVRANIYPKQQEAIVIDFQINGPQVLSRCEESFQ